MKHLNVAVLVFLLAFVPVFSCGSVKNVMGMETKKEKLDREGVNWGTTVDSLSTNDLGLLKKEVDSLETLLKQDRSSLSRSERRELNKRISDLQRDSTRLQELIAQQDQTMKELAGTIEDLQRQLEAMQPIKEQWISSLIALYSNKWAAVPFSQIPLDALDQDIADCKEYAKVDASLFPMIDDLSLLRSQVRVYQEGVKAVTSFYEKDVVNALIPEFDRLQQEVVGSIREDEVQRVGYQLRKFELRIKLFQKVIKQVDATMADFDTHSSAWPLAKRELKNIEEEMESITSICAIPWLAEQYDAYYKALSTNCKGPNKARDAILSIEL